MFIALSEQSVISVISANRKIRPDVVAAAARGLGQSPTCRADSVGLQIQYEVEQAQQRLMTMLAGSTMNLDPNSMEQLNAEVPSHYQMPPLHAAAPRSPVHSTPARAPTAAALCTRAQYVDGLQVTHWLALDRQISVALQTQRERPISPPTSPPPHQQTADEAACAFCGTDCAESLHVCPDCSSVCYCSTNCQSAAFPDHRLVCQSQQCSSNGVAPARRGSEQLSDYPDIDQLQRDLRDEERRRSGVQIGDSDCEDVIGDSDCEDVECSPRWHDDDDNFENVSARGGQYRPQSESDESDCESFSDRRSQYGSQAHRHAEDWSRSVSGKSQVSKSERVQGRKLNTAEVKARGRVKQYRAVKQAYLVPGRQYAHQRDAHQSRPVAVRLPNVNLAESTGAARLRPAGLYDPEPIEDLEVPLCLELVGVLIAHGGSGTSARAVTKEQSCS